MPKITTQDGTKAPTGQNQATQNSNDARPLGLSDFARARPAVAKVPDEEIDPDQNQPSGEDLENEFEPQSPEIILSRPEHIRRGRQIRDEIFALTGPVTLIAYHHRSKAAVFRHHLKVRIEQMDDDDYLAVLGRADRNTGILLGEESNGLISLDFDQPECAEAFLEQNPAFQNTLRTVGSRGCNLWVFIEGERPRSFSIKDEDNKNIVEFRADKRVTLIRGTHPSGLSYQVINRSTPFRIRYEEIIWPEGWRPKIDAALNGHAKEDGTPVASSLEEKEFVQKYGTPVLVIENRISLNQVSIAKKFLIENPVVSLPSVGFHEYDPKSGLWHPRSHGWVKKRVGEDIFAHADEIGAPQLKFKISDRNLTEIVNLVEAYGEVSNFSSKRNGDLIHVENGMLNFGVTPPVLMEFSPDYYSVNSVPFPYLPDARCPRFEEFLAGALGQDDVTLVQKWAGLALSGVNFAQAILLVTGCAGAGKGVMADVLVRIIGRDNCQELRTMHLDRVFEFSRFINKTLLVAPDVRGDFLNLQGAQKLKSLTGGDLLDAELKGISRGVKLKGIYNIIITSNRRLRVSLDGDHDAWERRLKVVEFTVPVEKKNPNLADQLIATEASGILNWMLEGLRLLRVDFAEHGRWCLTEEQKGRIENILLESNSVLAFVKDELEVGDEGNSITSQELCLAYERFCSDRGWSPLPKHTVTRELPDFISDRFHIKPRHDIQRAGSHQRGWSGIKFARALRSETLYESDSF